MHSDIDPDTDALAAQVVDAALKVHKALGPGLLESVYEVCVAHELAARGVPFKRQVPISVSYEGLQLDAALRLDVVVGDSLIVELKSVEALQPIHQSQLMTYLKLSGLRLGLLINFNTRLLRDGIKRIAL